jgi:F-box and WD-40 domain protein CDC4
MDNTVKVWDVATGECLHTLSGHTALVGLLATSPNYLVSAAADASLRIWDANTDSLKHILGAHGGAITCFAHDETKVVSGSEGSIKLWDIRTGQYIRELVVGIQSVWQVVFKDNILVAATSRAGATVFEIFDFGELDDCSGLDDARLDGYAKPAWERDDPREPQAYQFDDDAGEIIQNGTGGIGYPYTAGGGGSAVRYHGSRFRNPSFDPMLTTRSGRIASGRLGASGGSARADRGVAGSAGFPEAVLDPAAGAQLAQNLRFASDLAALDANAQAGPSNHHQHQPGHRRSSQLSRQSDSPTPVGSSNGGRDMLRSLRGSRSSASGSGRGDVIEDDDEDGWPEGVDVEQDLYRQYLAPSDGIEEPEGGYPLDAYPEADEEDEEMGREDGLAERAERFENDPDLEEEEEQVEEEEEISSPLPGLGGGGGGSGGLGNGQMFGWDTGVD